MHEPKVMAIAHRGASAYAPENTVAAFDEAIRLGAKAVEFDVHVTRDGEIVVIHDETVNRTTNGTGAVRELALFDLLRLDAGSWMHPRFSGTRIPTLDEALMAIGPHALPVIELKSPVPGEKLVKHLKRYDLLEACVVISFRPEWLVEVRKSSREVPIGYLSESYDSEVPKVAKGLDSEVLVVSTEAMGAGVAGEAEAAGLELWCYTANDIGLVAACAALGATGIITDKPELIRTR